MSNKSSPALEQEFEHETGSFKSPSLDAVGISCLVRFPDDPYQRAVWWHYYLAFGFLVPR